MEDTSLLVSERRGTKLSNQVHIAWSSINSMFILIGLCLLIIVLVLQFKDEERMFHTLSLPSSQSLKTGDIVSISADGTLSKGAGISVYKNTNAFATTNEVKHLHSVYMGNGVTVLCYYSTYAMIIPGRFNNQTLSMQWFTPVSLEHKQITCTNMERLGQSNNLIMIGNNQVMPFSVRDDGTSISFQFGQVSTYTQGFSMDPKIAVLSSSSAAISFYHTEDDNTTLHVGLLKLTGSGEQATFGISNNQVYATNHGSHQIMAFSGTEFVLCHPNDNFPDVIGAPLACILATIKDTIVLSPPVLLEHVQMNYFFDMALTSKNRGVIIFTDQSIDNGIRGVVLEILTKKSGERYLSFGSTIVINAGHGSGELPSHLWVYLNIEVLHQDRFVVAYSDLSNDGRITCILGEITNAASLNLISPELIISPPNPSFSMYYWIDVSIVSNNMFLVFDSLTSSDESQIGGTVAIGEMKNGVMGVVVGTNADSYEVQTTGKVQVGDGKLKPGRMYYVSTKGDLFAGAYYGDVSELDYDNYLIYDSTIISDSSKIGVALSSSEILLK